MPGFRQQFLRCPHGVSLAAAGSRSLQTPEEATLSCRSFVLALGTHSSAVSPVPLTVHILLFSLEKHGGGASSGFCGRLSRVSADSLEKFSLACAWESPDNVSISTHLENGTESEILLSLFLSWTLPCLSRPLCWHHTSGSFKKSFTFASLAQQVSPDWTAFVDPGELKM